MPACPCVWIQPGSSCHISSPTSSNKSCFSILSHSSAHIILGLKAGEENTHVQAIGVKGEAQENHTQGLDRFAGTSSSLPTSESSRKTNKVTKTPGVSSEDKKMW